MRESPFILGKLHEGYSEKTFDNRNHKLKQKINRDLKTLSEKLKLSVPLKLATARDAYATTLKRNGRSKDQIGEMMGHSNSIVTEHYLAALDVDEKFTINECLF